MLSLTYIRRVDFHTAAAFHTTPTFPQIHLDPDNPPLPDTLLEEAAFTSPTSLLQLPICAIDAFNIFYRLHRLALAISTPWIRKVDRMTTSNLLYECEYTILSVPDHSRDYLDFDRDNKGQGADEEDTTYDERKSQADAASIIEAILAATRTTLISSESNEGTNQSRTSSDRGSPMNVVEGGGADAGTALPRQRLVLKINPNAHRFDPFDVLPVQGSPQLDLLFKLCEYQPYSVSRAPVINDMTNIQLDKSGSRVNSIAINARNTWWNLVCNDAGLLHATLATWALYGMLVRGLSDLRVEKLRHKNEAIKEINTKIGNPGGAMSDELVGTVLTLASFEV